MGYRREIDGLRALAVLPVILFHADFAIFSGGFVGVDVFFVLSGYLITRLIVNEIDLQTFSIAGFYERRARRILPALFLVMACSIPIAWILLLPSDFVDFSQSLVANPLFIANFLFWMERGYFGVAAELKPLIHTWSLSVEEQFYVLFPLMFVFAWKKTLLLYALLSLTIIGSLTASYVITNLHFDTAFYLLPTRAWELLIGTCAALLLRKNIPALKANKKINDGLSFLGLFLILVAVFSFNNSTGQCPECKGNGRIKLEMDFLPSTWTHCDGCNGKRYNPATLEIRYNGRSIGDIVSYVACPEEYDTCDPDDLPEGTVYTYVLTVTPGVDKPNDPPFIRPVGLDEVKAATVFSTVRQASGFTGAIGYDFEQAAEALGPDGIIRVQDDNGTLVWRVLGGDGWHTGEPITFFWQSTLPPDGAAEAYSLRADEKIAMASGPFPPKEEDKGADTP